VRRRPDERAQLHAAASHCFSKILHDRVNVSPRQGRTLEGFCPERNRSTVNSARSLLDTKAHAWERL
jgi:hypothetical protein